MFPISKLTSQGVRLMKRGCLRRTRIHLALWVLGIVLAGTLLVTPAAGAVAQPFSDIPRGAWYGEAVAALSERGVLFPDENGAFRPDDPITRGELAVYLDRVLGLRGSTALPFIDVTEFEWYAGAVAALYEAGLTSGTSPTTYSPELPVTRQQAAVFVVRAITYVHDQGSRYGFDPALPAQEVDAWLGGFRDRLLIASAQAPAVANACRLGIMQGAQDGWFYPALSLTRAQMAAVLYRAFLLPLTVGPDLPEELPAVSTYPTQSKGSRGALVSLLEARLTALHYPCGPVDGIYDERTRDAVMAFEKVERLPRDGIAGPEFWQRIFSAQTPTPRLFRAGDRVEVDLARQVMFMIRGGEVVEIVHVSTGKLGTPTGHGQVWLRQRGWVQCSVGWMYFPCYFWPRIAIHGSSSVPPWPASHGCVRTPVWIAEHIYDQLAMGMPVDVYY